MRSEGGKKRIVWALIAGFILGLLVGLVLFYERGDTAETAGTDLDESSLGADDVALSTDDDRQQLETENTFVESSLVNVKDQTAGSEVFISRVELKQSGWVAIQEDDDGQPGNILGAQRFDSGVYQGTVKLLRPTQVDNVYHATLWADNGDKIFNFSTDTHLSFSGMQFKVF